MAMKVLKISSNKVESEDKQIGTNGYNLFLCC